MLTTLLILGAVQGVFLGVSLLGRKVNTTANRVLAVVMFVSAVFLLVGVFYAESYYLRFPHLIGFGQPLVFLFGPILYLYALLVSTGGQRFKKVWLLHFLPYLLNMLYFTPFILGSAEAKIEMVHSVMRDEDPFDVHLIENLKYIHGIIYVLLTIRLLRIHRSRLKDRFSSIERINLNWLRYLTIGIVTVWSVAILEWLVGLFLMDPLQINPFTPIAVAAFVYAIGYMGLRQPAIFGIQSVTHTASGSFIISPSPTDDGEPSPPEVGAPPVETPQASVSKYKKSGLSQDRADRILERLLSFMEEQKPFVRSTLTLQELSDELQISAHNLSEVINTRLGKNFFDFVNGFRVKEVQDRLADPKHDNFTILAIAQDAGFSSKSTFNTIFKKVTDTTPSEYRRKFQNVS